MFHQSLTLEFGDVSAPLRRAVIQEIVIRRYDGVGPDVPRVTRIILEYEDSRLPESVSGDPHGR